MIYYVNDKIVNYQIFKHYLTKSIKNQVNFTLDKISSVKFFYPITPIFL